MRTTLTIARRELMSLFCSPIGYVVIGLFAIGVTLIFFRGFYPGAEASVRGVLFGVLWLMVFLVPAISMRLLAEEMRLGTIEPLMTAPVSEAQVVLGKWVGAMGFLLTLFTPVILMLGVLELHSDPDYGPILTGLLGLLLTGGFFLAIGTFASGVSQSQIIAFLLTVFIICMLMLAADQLLRSAELSPGQRELVLYLYTAAQFDDFGRGLIDTSNVVYFLSGTALFLFLAVKVLESRRWR